VRDVHEAVVAFRQLVADPVAQPPLDEGAMLIAAVGAEANVDAGLDRLDELAAGARAARGSAGELADHLFVREGFTGNTTDYQDPRNSFLPDVMERRLGIPITLSVLMIEVGRRLGVALHGVGMPGHFLVGIDEEPSTFVDPFHAGVRLDPSDCRERFAALHGPTSGFRPEFLAATPPRMILLRMLANLRQTYVARRSPAVAWVVTLQLAFPELGAADRAGIADVLASVGAFTDAAVLLDDLAASAADATEATTLARRAVAYRARGT
jgi:regulator of sirC expression with transglutaminase-like and TPR domain